MDSTDSTNSTNSTDSTDSTDSVREWPAHPLTDWQAEVASGDTLQSYRDWAREREQGKTDEEADETITCRNCSQELAGDATDGKCTSPDEDEDEDEDEGEHVPDVFTHEVPEADPHRHIMVAFTLGVPNDGYDYATDIGGRLERIMGRVLEDRLVSSASTRGLTGSGYEGHAENPFR